MNQVYIAVAEDIPRLAQALINKLELNPHFKVVHVAPNGEKLLAYLQRQPNVDVVLMDIQMPVKDGIAATQELKKRYPQIFVIMSTVFDDEDSLFRAILAGANGYLLKDEPPAVIHQSIEMVLEGGAPMSPTIASKALRLIRQRPELTEDKQDLGLTTRETEILTHLSNGLSYEQIGGNLFISTGTVRKHIENIYKKLQVHNKVEALQVAMKNRIV